MRRRGRRAWGVALVAAPLGLLLSTAVLSNARAGVVPWPVRIPAANARLVAQGPPARAYPYQLGPTPSLDAYGFVTGQCTSFAAWWLNGHGLPFGVITVGPGGTGRFLNASSWDDAARSAGYRVGARPVVGAIAQWHAGEVSRGRDADRQWHRMTAGPPGHVAVVVRVLDDGQAEWLDYGWGGHPRLHTGHGFAPRYLYLGVEPPGWP